MKDFIQSAGEGGRGGCVIYTKLRKARDKDETLKMSDTCRMENAIRFFGKVESITYFKILLKSKFATFYTFTKFFPTCIKYPSTFIQIATNRI